MKTLVVAGLALLSSSLFAEGVPLDRAAAIRAVAFLADSRTETRDVGGKPMEVGLRPVGGKEFTPATEIRVGTGFFVGVGSRRFLVTAGHVAKEMGQLARVSCGADGESPATVLLMAIAMPNRLQWRHHSSSDLAALELDAATAAKQFPTLVAIDVTTLSTSRPARDALLEVFGFPLGLGISNVFEPISRQSRPASGLIKIPGTAAKSLTEIFYLQDPGIQGFSGAPVFEFSEHTLAAGLIAAGGTATCHGLVTATLSDNTGGKLASVIPAALIAEWIRTL